MVRSLSVPFSFPTASRKKLRELLCLYTYKNKYIGNYSSSRKQAAIGIPHVLQMSRMTTIIIMNEYSYEYYGGNCGVVGRTYPIKPPDIEHICHGTGK